MCQGKIQNWVGNCALKNLQFNRCNLFPKIPKHNFLNKLENKKEKGQYKRGHFGFFQKQVVDIVRFVN